MQHAGIQKETVISSAVNILEIWDKDRYEEAISEATVDFGALAEEVMGDKMKKTSYHDPVLLQPSVAALITDPKGVYVDATFGGGGHSQEILNQLDESGQLFAFDQDQDALENAIDDPRFTLIEANFKDIKRYLKLYGVKELTGVLADFGVSSHQFDAEERGFSIRFDGPLDMRMDQQASLDAADVVNDYSLESAYRLIQVLRGSKRCVSCCRGYLRCTSIGENRNH